MQYEKSICGNTNKFPYFEITGLTSIVEIIDLFKTTVHIINDSTYAWNHLDKSEPTKLQNVFKINYESFSSESNTQQSMLLVRLTNELLFRLKQSSLNLGKNSNYGLALVDPALTFSQVNELDYLLSPFFCCSKVYIHIPSTTPTPKAKRSISTCSFLRQKLLEIESNSFVAN